MIKENIKLENSEFVINKPIDGALFIELIDEPDCVSANGGYIGNGKNGFHAIEHAVQAIAEPLLQEGISDIQLRHMFTLAVCNGLKKAVKKTGVTPSKLSDDDNPIAGLVGEILKTLAANSNTAIH